MLSSFKSKKWNVFLPVHLWAFSNGVNAIITILIEISWRIFWKSLYLHYKCQTLLQEHKNYFIYQQKKFLWTGHWKENIFIIFYRLPNLSVKRPKTFLRACLLLNPKPMFSNYLWSKNTWWYGNKIACMLCYFAQFRCCW